MAARKKSIGVVAAAKTKPANGKSANGEPRAKSVGSRLTHLDDAGRARMVDVGDKRVTERTAVASARVRMKPETLALLMAGQAPKGDVLAVARVAAIQAAKRTPELIPLCHQIALTSCVVELTAVSTDLLEVRASVRAADRTGAEMEAMVAASIGALTVYDMLKAIDRGMTVEQVAVLSKAGGKSGTYTRDTNTP